MKPRLGKDTLAGIFGTDNLKPITRPKSREISLENLLILKIHNKDMRLIVYAILSKSKEELKYS
jgi:hypothetical protein